MDARIKAAIFLPNLEIGGAENLVLNLIEAFLESDEFAFHLVLLGRGGKLTDRAMALRGRNDFQFTELGLPLAYGWSAARVLNRFLTLQGITLIHSHLYECDKTCVLLKLLNPRVKIISTKHSTLRHPWKTAAMNFLSQFLFAKIVFITPYQRAFYRRNYLVFRNTALVENGAVLPIADPGAAPVSPGQGEREIRLACIGSFRREKGQDILITALNILGRKSVRFRCDLFGDGPDRDKLEKAVEPGANVHFNEARPGISGELHRFDLIIIPSRREGSCLIMLESFLAKVPVLASDYPVLAEKAGGGRRSALFKSEDAADLAGKIEAFLENPADQRRLVEPAYRYALDFSIGRTAENYLRLYREAAGGEETSMAVAGPTQRNMESHDT